MEEISFCMRVFPCWRVSAAVFTLGKAVRWGHYENQIGPQLLPRVGTYSGNGLTLHFYYWYFPILWGHYLLQLLKYNVIWRLFCFFTKRINYLLGSLLLFSKLWVFLLIFFSKNWWKLMVRFFSSEGMGAGPSINSIVGLSFCFLSRRGDNALWETCCFRLFFKSFCEKVMVALRISLGFLGLWLKVYNFYLNKFEQFSVKGGAQDG